MNPPRWMQHAACIDHPDPDAWFAHLRDEPERVQQAISICKACPVRRECFDYARAEKIDYGIWGGMTPAARCGRGRPREPLQHGTYNGYRTHLRWGEKACRDCLRAAADYQAAADAKKNGAPRYLKCAHPFGCESWAQRGDTLCWVHARKHADDA